jgi:hypothetical protein
MSQSILKVIWKEIMQELGYTPKVLQGLQTKQYE